MEKNPRQYDFVNIVFFKSLRNGATIGQTNILGKDHIILVPDKFKKGIKKGLSYNIKCHKLQKGSGFVVDYYEHYVPSIEVTLSKDYKNVVVMRGELPTSYSYTLSGRMSPREFYESKKFNFNADIKTPLAFLKWKAALQQISQYWELTDWDEYVVTSSKKPLEEVEEDKLSYEPNWHIDELDEVTEK